MLYEVHNHVLEYKKIQNSETLLTLRICGPVAILVMLCPIHNLPFPFENCSQFLRAGLDPVLLPPALPSLLTRHRRFDQGR